MSVTSFASKPLMIERQGQFPVGGTTITRPGTFDPDTFTGWTNPVQDGQTYRCDHAFARYQIPTDARKLPLVFVHGFGSDGVCWETTPDGRDKQARHEPTVGVGGIYNEDFVHCL